MTALPDSTTGSHGESGWAIPDHLLSVAEYAALGEPDSGFTELVEGRLVMSPSPKRRHNKALYALARQLESQLPDHLEFVQDIDVDLGLVPPGQPGFARRPDLIIARRQAGERIDAEDTMYHADDVVVVVEIVSPGSKRTDYVTKHGEYADAGIPHYWIVDLSEPVSLVSCHQAGELGYQDAPAATGEFGAAEPFPVKLDLDRLLS
ncbi:Uma2 family endonuclease [Amycolatopsis sp. lyj-112]|uniref:Uma2 family endonuclease n=1 Tax=Amycolatopsis sp. lyj-112 TaxID=2789288 RepID=UPI00397C7117